ncbi:MAG TPA: tripartite tricarboxylate transporter TctB family protein [Azospirillum sp.]|nr:tripartite tricarboxylate transporter TctB family protein [Azospirillum sp.]
MEHGTQNGEPVVTSRTMEIVVAGLFALVALVVMADSVRVGNGWGSDGPKAGYFPFYVGLIMLCSSLAILAVNIFRRTGERVAFVERDQFRQVLQVLLPSLGFVLLSGVVGLYVSAILFIAFFMHWVGKYPPKLIAPIALLVPAALFVMFEVWFLVPLPKGPVEAFFGY